MTLRACLLLSLCLLLMSASRAMALDVTSVPSPDGGMDQMTVTTKDYRATIVFSRGARLSELVNLSTGRSSVAWEDAAGGGMLDDRLSFTEGVYQTSDFKHDASQAVVMATARSDSGVEIRKHFTFTEGRPFFTVRYTLLNRGYQPVRFWVRNLGVPDGGELDDTIQTRFQTVDEIRTFDRYPSEYHTSRGGWMTLRRGEQGPGIFLHVDPATLDQFYFWTGSRTAPTFEWIHPPLAPGHQLDTTVHVGVIRQGQAVAAVMPDGSFSTTPTLAPAAERARHEAIPGWKPLDELYQPTADEKARGFILTQMSEDEPRQRLSSVVAHVGRQEGELLPVELFAMRDLSDVSIAVEDAQGRPLAVAVGEVEKDFQLLPGQPLAKVAGGSYVRLWVRVLPQGSEGDHQGKVVVRTAQGQAEIPLVVKVWPVDFPRELMSPLKSYSYPRTMGSEDYITGKDRQRYPAMLRMLQALGVQMIEEHFDFRAAGMLRGAKEKKTGRPLQDWLREHAPITPDQLPDLDLSVNDPVVKLAIAHGVTRLDLEAPLSLDTRGSALGLAYFIRQATGQDQYDTDTAAKYITWLATQMRDYYRSHGITDLWVKIGDEISAGDIDAWLASARVYRPVGFKTYTTNSIGIPRDAALLNKLLPETDGWQVANVFTQDFFQRTRLATIVTRRHHALVTPSWWRYANGGAVNTWHSYARGGASIFPQGVDAMTVEHVEVHADGRKLTYLPGVSPWGNKHENTFYLHGGIIYLSLGADEHPKDVKLEIAYTQRLAAEAGSDQGKPAVDIGDRPVTFYTGGGYFKTSYLANRANTWLGTAYDLDGQGYYVAWHWLPDRRLWWYDEGKVTSSPSYEGLRDGQEDGAWYRAMRKAGASAEDLERIVGGGPEAALPLTQLRSEHYAWNGVERGLPITHYTLAKQRMLQWLVQASQAGE